jgi:hypothetical protein
LLSSNSPHFLKLIISLWLAFVVSGLVYFQAGQLKAFDGNQILLQKSWFADFKKQLAWDDGNAASLVLVMEPSCGCAKQAKNHISSLKKFAKNNGINIVQLPFSQNLKHVIPATPAAVIIDKNGKFVYAGPLSEGLACSQGSGFVETVITNLAAGFNSELLIADTKGCYCVSDV